MKRIHRLFLAALFTSACFAQAEVETYKIDPVHSTVEFKVKHLGISKVNGTFADFEGIVNFDTENPENSSVEVTVKADSVDTRNQKRDAHLRTDDFFGTEKHPVLSFKSTAVKKTGDNTYEVTGNFTLLGNTKPITFTFTDLGKADGMKEGEVRRGGETSFTLKRSDFGMHKMIGPIGDEVEVTLAFSGIKQ
jgi:polyisoprenoid-binding protein YceI